MYVRTEKTGRSGHKSGQRQQCSNNAVHEISLLVFPFTTANHMDDGRPGNTRAPLCLCRLVPALDTVLLIMCRKNFIENMKTLAPHWFFMSDWLLSACVFLLDTLYMLQRSSWLSGAPWHSRMTEESQGPGLWLLFPIQFFFFVKYFMPDSLTAEEWYEDFLRKGCSFLRNEPLSHKVTSYQNYVESLRKQVQIVLVF